MTNAFAKERHGRDLVGFALTNDDLEAARELVSGGQELSMVEDASAAMRQQREAAAAAAAAKSAAARRDVERFDARERRDERKRVQAEEAEERRARKACKKGTVVRRRCEVMRLQAVCICIALVGCYSMAQEAVPTCR